MNHIGMKFRKVAAIPAKADFYSQLVGTQTLERVGCVPCDHGTTDDGVQRRYHHGDDGLRVVATVGKAIRRPSDRDRFGQCAVAVSTLQVGRRVGEGAWHDVAVPSGLFTEPELD